MTYYDRLSSSYCQDRLKLVWNNERVSGGSFREFLPPLTRSLFLTSQLRPFFAVGPKVSQAQARSYILWRPIQVVCVPGSFSERST